MFLLKGLYSNVTSFYKGINGATLTGAIDVVVVQQPDGSFLCSPFHVRFGKMGVLRAREKVVDIEINGEPVDIHMKLGESGEAFFVEEPESDEDISTWDPNLATSPIPENTSLASTISTFDSFRDPEEEDTIGSLPANFHPYSDGELSPFPHGSPKDESLLIHHRPASPLSDSEFEHEKRDPFHSQHQTTSPDMNATWGWGEMPKVPERKTPLGLVDDIDLDSIPSPQGPASLECDQVDQPQGKKNVSPRSNPVKVPTGNNSSSSIDGDDEPDTVIEADRGSIVTMVPVSERKQTGSNKKNPDETAEEAIQLDKADSNYCSGGEDGMASPRSDGSDVPRSNMEGLVIDTSCGSESSPNNSNSQRRRKKRRAKTADDHKKDHKKSLKLSSDQLASLNLLEGPNDAVFSVTTAYQGTWKCECTIYLWHHEDKIVVSDIDGTITKSDVLGHILPILGNDWSQSGVTKLFNKISDNGYRLLYLSARAIGQANTTRGYLRSVRQGELELPEGPVFLNPTSLISAFHREIIEKKPEEFKIQCLTDIKNLFPTNPFYAGFGNKINDTWAYRAMDIHLSRIFTINHRGELKLELIQAFQSSYTRLSDVVDQMFPPTDNNSVKRPDFLSEYSAVNYWRAPLMSLPDLEQDELVKALTDTKISSKSSTSKLSPKS